MFIMCELPGLEKFLLESLERKKKELARDEFHNTPFDEATREKLEIFKLYAKEWLPVFLARRKSWPKEIHIFDFFSGPGRSSEGELGSPLLLLEEIKNTLLQEQCLHGWKNRKIALHFFDADANKITLLKKNVPEYLNILWHDIDYPPPEIQIEQKIFPESLEENISILKDGESAKYILLDQFGVKLITPEILKFLSHCPSLDLIMFMASNFFNRFAHHTITKSFGIDGNLPKQKVHNEVFRKLKSYDVGCKKYMAPFSLKKELSNIYGIIFLSSSWLGMDKFLKICWQLDPRNGEANYSIEDDDKAAILSNMDSSVAPFSKTERFAKELREKLLFGEFNNEHELAEFCYDCCMLPKHCSKTLSRMKREGLIDVTFTSPSLRNNPPRVITVVKSPQANFFSILKMP